MLVRLRPLAGLARGALFGLTACLPRSEEATASATCPGGKCDEATPVETLSQREKERLCVPPSIMLHSKNVAGLKSQLIPWLVEQGYATITYADYARILDGTQRRPRRAVILSIDDVPTDWIRSEFKAMVAELLKAKLTTALAVNTTQAPEAQKPSPTAPWQVLRDWQAAGSELDSHGTEHLNQKYWAARALEGNRLGDERLRYLIDESFRRLEAGLGRAPMALILPFGIPEAETPELEVVRARVREAGGDRAGRFIVGIPKGRLVAHRRDDAGTVTIDYPVFVGRVEIQSTRDRTAWEIVHWYRNTPACQGLEEGIRDGGVLDGGGCETGPCDASPHDAGRTDGATRDAAPQDARRLDGAPRDAELRDAAPRDARTRDAGSS